MSWDEFRTRVGQEAGKRLDLALYRAGLHPSVVRLNGQGPAPGRFFFLADELPSRASLLRQHLPAQVETILSEADEICAHRFQLLGYNSLDYGPEIDWHLDAAHGKRAPLKPWFKIDFLDFAEVGDHKVTWELNRHQHLVTLAKAWRLTQDERYPKELLQQWYAWQRANPYPLGINWGSSLEVAFRSLSWLWVRSLLAGCPAVPAALETDLLQALARNGRYIHRYLSTYFSPNTHLIGEAVALFFIGTVCPGIPDAAKWRGQGWQILLQAAKDQVRLDGVYFEQSLYYHVYALDFFLHARHLAAHNQIEIPSNFDQALRKMLDVVEAVSQSGPPDGFGDDDGGRVFNPRRNRAEHLSDPLALGATTFGRNDLAGASLTEEAIWLFGEQTVACLGERSGARSRPQPSGFEAGGIYVSVSPENVTQQMVIDAGPQGTGRSGHGHADALSVRVSADGRRWLVDPGTYCYISDNDERNRFRGTAAHNTLRVDGQDQAVPEGPFAWGSLPLVRAECWLTGETFSLLTGSHTGYLRLPDPVLHRRCVFHLFGSFWLVLDSATGRASHELDIFWHFAPDLKVLEEKGGFIAAPNPDAASSTGLGLLPVAKSDWKCEVASDYVSPAYGCKVPAPVVRMSSRVQLPAQMATVLFPSVRHSDLGELGEVDANSARGYRLRHGDITDYMIFGEREGASWSLGPWASDADFLYCGVENQHVTHLVFCGGSFVKIQGQGVLTHHRKIERFEWLIQGGVRRIFSSDDTAGHSLSEGPLASGDPVF